MVKTTYNLETSTFSNRAACDLCGEQEAMDDPRNQARILWAKLSNYWLYDFATNEWRTGSGDHLDIILS